MRRYLLVCWLFLLCATAAAQERAVRQLRCKPTFQLAGDAAARERGADRAASLDVTRRPGLPACRSFAPCLPGQARLRHRMLMPISAGIDFYGDPLIITISKIRAYPDRARALLALGDLHPLRWRPLADTYVHLVLLPPRLPLQHFRHHSSRWPT